MTEDVAPTDPTAPTTARNCASLLWNAIIVSLASL